MRPLDLQAIRERLEIYSEDHGDPHSVVDRLGRDPRANSEARGIAGLLVGLERVYRQDVPDLLALVDLQTRTLLALEFVDASCGACTGGRFQNPPPLHEDDCPVDAALRAAGLDTQAKRDAAREAMGGGR